MAPELLNGQGYDSSVDWWSLGVVLFEMLYNERPFKGKNKREKIKRGNFVFLDNTQQSNNVGSNSAPAPASYQKKPLKRGGSQTSQGHEDTEIQSSRSFTEGVNQKDANKGVMVSEKCRKFVRGLLEMDVEKRLGNGEKNLVLLKNHEFFEGIDWVAVEKKQTCPLLVPNSKRNNFDYVDTKIFDLEFGGQKKEIPVAYAEEKMLMIEREFLYYDHNNPSTRGPRPEVLNDLTKELRTSTTGSINNNSMQSMLVREGPPSVVTSQLSLLPYNNTQSNNQFAVPKSPTTVVSSPPETGTVQRQMGGAMDRSTNSNKYLKAQSIVMNSSARSLSVCISDQNTSRMEGSLKNETNTNIDPTSPSPT
ncbi:hypothetical protein HK096_010727 [Nowakowskiella sp. JEL0078]|nr:hypothetical protein HK096_010727 [Nowakowskiella sp. JEL0078]